LFESGDDMLTGLTRPSAQRLIPQIGPDIRHQGSDGLNGFIDFGHRPAQFTGPMPHFCVRVDVDTIRISGRQQASAIVFDCHASRAMRTIAIKASAGTTIGGTNQIDINDRA
jgi:hypothetical protein